ncbi:pro-thyrotropin-releasing hormone [Rhinoraja longicauda]
MRSLWFLLLLHSVSVVAGQRAAEVAERQLQRAEAALVHAVLREMGQGGNNANEADSPSAELISKRQHPGKRLEDLEKRQYPGKREVGEDEEVDYREVEKRQHPGRRGADWLHSGEEEVLSKRQHPGKKRLVLSSQSRQPGRGGWETESDSREIEAQTSARQLPSPCDSRDPVVCDLLQLLGVVSKTEKKRQHPGR